MFFCDFITFCFTIKMSSARLRAISKRLVTWCHIKIGQRQLSLLNHEQYFKRCSKKKHEKRYILRSFKK